LISAAGLPDQDLLSLSASPDQLAAAVSLIEDKLGLPPLVASRPTLPTRAKGRQ
jgi:hypothetical protein